MNIYSIKDTKLGYNSTFVMANNAAAIRTFADICKDKDTVINRHPEDYELYCLGELNADTGVIIPCVTFLERATAFLKTEE